MTDIHIHFAAVPDEERPPFAECRPPGNGSAVGSRQLAVGGPRSAVESDLAADEIAKANRFLFERDRRLYIAAHSFLRRTLATYLGCAPREVAFVADAHGKPELADRRVRFNLSHTPGLVMVGVTHGVELGVDVEEIQRPIDMQSVAPVVFTPSEREAWRGDRSSFFRTWTLKESYLKARGLGLSLDLQGFGFEEATPPRMVCQPGIDDAGAWQFAEFAPTPRHCAAAAVRASEVRWVVHEHA